MWMHAFARFGSTLVHFGPGCVQHTTQVLHATGKACERCANDVCEPSDREMYYSEYHTISNCRFSVAIHGDWLWYC